MVIRRVNLAAYPQVIQVEAGDIIRATTEFDYIGPALTGTLYTALWRSIWFDPHDEIANKSRAFSLPDSPAPGNHISIYVDIPFPQGYPEGLHYGLYSKIMGVPGEPRTQYYDKIIELVAVAPPPEPGITDLTIVTPTKSTWIGGSIYITVMFKYLGPATSGQLYAAIGIKDTWFNEKWDSGWKTVSISAAGFPQTRLASASIPIVGGSPGKYDIYAKIRAPGISDVFSPIYLDTITITL